MFWTNIKKNFKLVLVFTFSYFASSSTQHRSTNTVWPLANAHVPTCPVELAGANCSWIEMLLYLNSCKNLFEKQITCTHVFVQKLASKSKSKKKVMDLKKVIKDL
jgi:hypothetical protein